MWAGRVGGAVVGIKERGNGDLVGEKWAWGEVVANRSNVCFRVTPLRLASGWQGSVSSPLYLLSL